MNAQDVDGRTKQTLSLEEKRLMIVLVRHNTRVTICKVFVFVVVAKSSAKLSLLKGTLGNCCLTKGSGLMKHVTIDTIPVRV